MFPVILLDDGSLLLYEYERGRERFVLNADASKMVVNPAPSKISWIGLFFYLHFVPVWGLSCVVPVAILWSIAQRRHLWLVTAYIALLVWLYTPPKIRVWPCLQPFARQIHFLRRYWVREAKAEMVPGPAAHYGPFTSSVLATAATAKDLVMNEVTLVREAIETDEQDAKHDEHDEHDEHEKFDDHTKGAGAGERLRSASSRGCPFHGERARGLAPEGRRSNSETEGGGGGGEQGGERGEGGAREPSGVLNLALAPWAIWMRQMAGVPGLAIVKRLQLSYFYNIARYYDEASFRFLRPGEHPELNALVALVRKAPRWIPRPDGALEKRIFLDTAAILALQHTPAFDSVCRVCGTRCQPFPCDLWAASPHGFTCNGWSSLSVCPFVNQLHNGLSSVLYYFGHLIIFYTSLLGNPHPVTSASIDETLRRRHSLSLVVGGFEEATLNKHWFEFGLAQKSHNHAHAAHTHAPAAHADGRGGWWWWRWLCSLRRVFGDRLYLTPRFGIFKKALDHKAGIIPFFTFGEAAMFLNVPGLWSFRLLLNRFSIPAAFCIGRWGTYLPRPQMMHIVVGPRLLPANHNVLSLKRAYVQSIVGLHAAFGPAFYRDQYQTLEII